MARQLCETRQRQGVAESAPAIHDHEDGDGSVPGGLHPESKHDEPSGADQAKGGHYHEAAGPSDYKPEKGSKNLAAVERIDGEHVENQQAEIDVKQGTQ